MEEINEFITELENLKTNLKKSINRLVEKSYVDNKLAKLQSLKNRVNEISEQLQETETEEIIDLKSNFFALIEENSNILEKLKIKETRINQEETQFSKMANFDMSLVGKNLQMFSGKFKFLDDFLTQTELLNDLIKPEERQIFIKYVYNFKLTTQVRSILGRSNKPTTFNELKIALESAYPNPRTLQQVLSELGAVKQHNCNITEFREKIAELSDQLSAFEIKALPNATQEAKDVIYKVSDSLALNTFIKGVNADYKQILLSNVPKTLNEAVERCMTAEKINCTEEKSVYHMKGHNNNSNSKRYKNYKGNNNNYKRDSKNYGNNNKNNYTQNQDGNNKNYNDNKTYNRSNDGNHTNTRKDGNNNYNRNKNNNYRNRNYRQNDNDYKRNNNDEERSYRSYNFTGDQENCDGRVTENVAQSAEN